MDAVYGCLITVVPFVIMLSLNLLICRRLRRARKLSVRLQRVVAEESRLRLEFTAILLVVSSTFIVLNVPFYVAWCIQYVLSATGAAAGGGGQLIDDWSRLIDEPVDMERARDWVSITKTIFFGNYCINFFIYSLSGAYFRHQLLRHVTCLRRCHQWGSGDFGGDQSNTRRRALTTGCGRRTGSKSSVELYRLSAEVVLNDPARVRRKNDPATP